MRLPNTSAGLSFTLCLILFVSSPQPPPNLLIYRDAVLAGRAAAYREIEEDAARICTEMHCPNHHVAIESLTGPAEVWWLTEFASTADKQRIINAYTSNAELSAALAVITQRKVGVVGTPLEVYASYRADLSRAVSWEMAGARFFVVRVTKSEPTIPGSVFETADGTRYIFWTARTRAEAERLAAAAGGETTVFALRPYWGMPAKEWIAADPEFWKPNPASRLR